MPSSKMATDVRDAISEQTASFDTKLIIMATEVLSIDAKLTTVAASVDEKLASMWQQV